MVADTSASTASVLAGVPSDERAAIAGELEAAFAPYRHDGGYDVAGLTLCAIAR